MYENFEPEYVTPTVDEVFERLRAQLPWEYMARFRGEAALFEPTLDTTIETLLDECDPFGDWDWLELANGCQKLWSFNAPTGVWRQVLTPENKRTVRELCEFLAPRILVPRVRAVSVLGKECRKAGAFLALRSMLGKAGVPMDGVRPSTPLADIARRYGKVIDEQLKLLAPGIGSPEVEDGLLNRCARKVTTLGFRVLVAGVIAVAIGSSLGIVPVVGLSIALAGWIAFLVGLATGAVGGIGWAITSASLPPKRVTFGRMRTFRDMAAEVAR